METKVKVIYSVVGFLGVLSIALFVAAEVTRVKASQIQFTSSSTCLYPNSPAFGLGLTAAVSLMVAQIIITIAAGCFYCTPGSYQSDCRRTLEVIFFVLSWYILARSPKENGKEISRKNHGLANSIFWSIGVPCFGICVPIRNSQGRWRIVITEGGICWSILGVSIWCCTPRTPW